MMSEMTNAELGKMIARRKSVRKFSTETVDSQMLERIAQFCEQAKPLNPDIRVRSQIVSREQVRFYLPWKAPHLIAVFSENRDGYAENVGFLFQQVDLFLQSIGLGCCWLGLGKLRQIPAEDGMEFVILLAFGHPDEEPLRSDVGQFRRRELGQIADVADARLEPARLAPSSTNSQPWYFTHEGDVIHAYCSDAGVLRHKMLGTMNRIDMGIALAHMYVANADTFRYFTVENAKNVKGCRYTGSFTI